MRLPPDIANSPACPASTAVDRLDVISRQGVFDVVLDGRVVDIGTVLKVKCTIGQWRGVKQLEMKRASVVRTAAEEARAWVETARFRRDVLARPWVLSPEQLARIERELGNERRREQEKLRLVAEKERRRKEKRRVWEEKMRRYEERKEKQRRREEVVMNAGALV